MSSTAVCRWTTSPRRTSPTCKRRRLMTCGTSGTGSMKAPGGCSAWSKRRRRRPRPTFTGRRTVSSPTTSTGSRKGPREMKMQKTRTRRLAGVRAVVLAAGLWALVPAWGQSSAAKGMAGMSGTGNAALTRDIAAARVATAKYATNLDAAKADGYQILTKEIPGMGFHFVNPNVSGFDVTKPPILVYEHTGGKWQLGA